MEPKEIWARAPWCERSLTRSVLSRILAQELDVWLKTMVSRGISDDHIRDELLERTDIDIKASTIAQWRRQLGYVAADKQGQPRLKAVRQPQSRDQRHG